MSIHATATSRLMSSYGVFASTERVLMELGKKGADRQKMHEVIREESLKAWVYVQEGKENPLKNALMENNEILSYLSKEEIEKLLDASGYTGDAVERTNLVLERARNRSK